MYVYVVVFSVFRVILKQQCFKNYISAMPRNSIVSIKFLNTKLVDQHFYYFGGNDHVGVL